MEQRSSEGAVPGPDDQRMWRLLLARLHPDAGGDHELFVFASNVRDSVCGGEHLGEGLVRHGGWRPGYPAMDYLLLWQTMMSPWTYVAHGGRPNTRA